MTQLHLSAIGVNWACQVHQLAPYLFQEDLAIVNHNSHLNYWTTEMQSMWGCL